MTIKEYFEKEQPISDAVIEESSFYKDIATIELKVSDAQYGIIKIAHVGENLWAFGYEIKINATAPVICKDCTTHAITRGYIQNLIYGMIQVLLLHLQKVQHTQKLEQVIKNGLIEAAAYYKRDAKSIGKITF